MSIYGINPMVPPSGTGCGECLASKGWWVHLRRCAQCGHIGCCDTSPSQHATNHFKTTGHPVAATFEPGEEWMWNYESQSFIQSTPLAPPQSRPEDQPVPAPADNVPATWRDLIHR